MDNFVAPNLTSDDNASPRSQTTFSRVEVHLPDEYPLFRDEFEGLGKSTTFTDHTLIDLNYVKQRDYDTLRARVETLEELVKLMSRTHAELADEVKKLRAQGENSNRSGKINYDFQGNARVCVKCKSHSSIHVDDGGDPDYTPLSDECKSSPHVTPRQTKTVRRRSKRPTSRGSRGTSKTKKVNIADTDKYTTGKHVPHARAGPVRLPVVPQWIPVSFRPPEDMHLVGDEVVVAAYIFSTEAEASELLVAHEQIRGTRETFMTVVPTQPLVDEVLTMVASMMSHNSCRTRWFMSPTFAYYLLGRISLTSGTLEWFRKNYMGKVDTMTEIYIPIWRDSHWFLLVVDTIHRQLVYLDSLRSYNCRWDRILAIKEVVIAIERIISDPSWYTNPAYPRWNLSDFQLTEEFTNQQDPSSNDCGVWVAQWMIVSRLNKDYKSVKRVTDETRMRLAVDLVMKDYNPLREQIIQQALAFWKQKRDQTHHIN